MHFYRTDSEYRSTCSEIDTARCPVYLMTGEYDYSCTPELTIETAARIPGAEAIIMDGIGHFPMSENPEKFARFSSRYSIASPRPEGGIRPWNHRSRGTHP